MNYDGSVYDYNELHQQQLREEAERERLAKQLPRKPGLLQTALALLSGKLTD